MKKLFNSPYFIVALVCVAGYFIYTNAIAPMISDSNAVEENPPEFIESLDQQAEPSTIQHHQSLAIRSVDIKSLYWNESPKRDPFKPKLKILKKDIAEAVKIRKKIDKKAKKIVKKTKLDLKKQKHHLKPEILPVLSGLVSGSSTRQAILDGKIVSEGQNIKQFRIVAIEKNGVLIKSNRRGSEYFLSASQ